MLVVAVGPVVVSFGDADGAVLVSDPQPAPLAALSRRVKEAFDPAHILNPGRMVEGI